MVPPKRILLIEDDSDYEHLVRAVLVRGEYAFELKSVTSLASGLSAIGQFTPHVILVDLNLGDSAGYQTFQRVQERADGIPIIVLTGLDDDRTAIRAVEDGAQDYLVKNLVQPKLIARCLTMAVSRHNRQARRQQGTVLGFIGSKGGVGTSTVAINVAALLAQTGSDTLFIELQLGRPGSGSMYLETEPTRGLNSLLRLPPNRIGESVLRDYLCPTAYRLLLLCAAGSEGLGRQLGGDYAHAIISAARRAFRFVILDLPARLDEGVAEALKLSDSVTMLVDREPASLYCGSAFVEQLKVAASGNHRVRLAVVDRTALPSPVPLAEIENQMKLHALAMVPAAGSAIALSQSTRTPLVLLSPEDGFSLATIELAEQLIPAAVATEQSLDGVSGSLSRSLGSRAIPETMYS